MEIAELKEFVLQNGLTIDLVQAREDRTSIAYIYKGYQGDRLLFSKNKFDIKKTVKLDVLGTPLWDIIAFLKHENWLYDMFIQHEGVKPLERYVEGRRLFIKVLNVCGPPVIWRHHEGARLQVITDNFNTEQGFAFYADGHKVAEISERAIITPKPIQETLPNHFIARFDVQDADGMICEIFWPR